MIELAHVSAALNLSQFDSASAHQRMSPSPRINQRTDPAREAAVLVLLHPQADGRLCLILTRRRDDLRTHSGQVSFAGGRRDEHDASFAQTALRETCEELGICDDIELLGTLSPLYIPPSHFNVYPQVGYIAYPPLLRPNPQEVAEVLSLCLDDLLNPALKATERRTLMQGLEMDVPFYWVQGHKVWGATAIMLGELEARLRMVLPQEMLLALET